MNISRIVLGLLLIVGAGGALAGGTSAFFSDTETSTGNSFTAGAIDLKIDNDSYYNGNRCTNTGTLQAPIFVWQGNAAFPIVGTPCTTSWLLDDLGNGLLFFNFTDVKPDDEGEDTISIHVQNDAWACLDMTLTSDNDNSSVEPELGDGDPAEDPNDTWDGELADTIQMFWWADDGDNVYEVGENHITNGVQTITNMFGPDRAFTATLADSLSNIWGPPGPLPGGQTVYIAKAWCMGTLSIANPVAAGAGVNPGVDSGVDCDGTALNNLAQTDGLTMDIAFRAMQSRHNPNYVCRDDQPRTATITVIKQITNNDGGNNVIADFQLEVDNGTVTTGVTSSISTNVVPGTYTVTETGVQGYVASFIPGVGQDCNAGGQVTLAAGESKTCIITNNDLPAVITLVKNVTGIAPLASPTVFGLRVDGVLVQHTTSVSTTSNSVHTINEDGRVGYTFVGPITGTSNYGQSCPAALGGAVTLAEGEAMTCTITNNKN